MSGCCCFVFWEPALEMKGCYNPSVDTTNKSVVGTIERAK